MFHEWTELRPWTCKPWSGHAHDQPTENWTCVTTGRPRYDHELTMRWLWDDHGLAMEWPWVDHGLTMGFPFEASEGRAVAGENKTISGVNFSGFILFCDQNSERNNVCKARSHNLFEKSMKVLTHKQVFGSDLGDPRVKHGNSMVLFFLLGPCRNHGSSMDVRSIGNHGRSTGT